MTHSRKVNLLARHRLPGIVSPGTAFNADTSMQESLGRAHLALVSSRPSTLTAGCMAQMAPSSAGIKSSTTVT
ncbi:hypothetical protein E2C01_027663 [Portunus trituberculatus]|uniref:Uncharacterized protein n=1 Tax=Portunus trituberculatus TaxID=210409 RepID=A0A5B7EM85_PORTR|nr:hypothetical protein [Portunus trituberculatus]